MDLLSSLYEITDVLNEAYYEQGIKNADILNELEASIFATEFFTTERLDEMASFARLFFTRFDKLKVKSFVIEQTARRITMITAI